MEAFKSAILIERDEAIGELSVRVSPQINQIRVLAKLLAVHPDGKYYIVAISHRRINSNNLLIHFFIRIDTDRTISYGSEFLGYLYGEILGVVQQDIYALLIFILSQCCDVYFR